jgi:hypothetical protein
VGAVFGMSGRRIAEDSRIMGRGVGNGVATKVSCQLIKQLRLTVGGATLRPSSPNYVNREGHPEQEP